MSGTPSSSYRLRDAVATPRWWRDASWQERWDVVSYPLKTWRCRLFGHAWGPEHHDYDPNIGAKLESWRECHRDGCEGWWETYHYMAEGEQRVFG